MQPKIELPKTTQNPPPVKMMETKAKKSLLDGMTTRADSKNSHQISKGETIFGRDFYSEKKNYFQKKSLNKLLLG